MARVLRPMTSALVALSLGYGGICGWLWWNEDILVFPGAGARGKLDSPDPALGLMPRRVETVTTDGVRLVGWVITAKSAGPDAPWLLLLHGNGGDISNAGRPKLYRDLGALGLNIVTFDYRGYGESDGQPDEPGLYRDADAMYAFLRDRLGVPPERIVIFGQSLGSAVAVDLAARVPARALILDGALTSVPEVGARAYPFIPVRLLARNRFASDEKIARVAVPKLFLHARQDRVVPFDLGRRLYERATPPKQFVELSGGHNHAFEVDSATYFAAIDALLVELRSGP